MARTALEEYTKNCSRKLGSRSTSDFMISDTFSTLAIQSGIDPKTVAEILGHASAEFSLDVYTHVTAGMKKEAAQKISGFMASVG